MRSLAILGSTGSIGTQALDVVRRNPDRFRVVRAARPATNHELLVGQIREFLPPLVAIADEQAAEDAEGQARASRASSIMSGPDAAETARRGRPRPTWC